MKTIAIRSMQVGGTELKISTVECSPKFNLDEAALKVKRTGVDHNFTCTLIFFTDEGSNEKHFEFDETFEFKGACTLDIDLETLMVEKLEDILGEILVQSGTITVSGLDTSGAHSDDSGSVTLKSPLISPGTLTVAITESDMDELFTPSEQ